MQLRHGVAGRERRIEPCRTSIVVLATRWDTLAEGQAGAVLAAGLLVQAAARPAEGVEVRAS
jgi:hypothetical protein